MSETKPISRVLAEFVLDLDIGQVAPEVLHETRRIFLDCIGCAVAGRVHPAGQIAADLVREERGALNATVVGGSSVSVAPAALANTVLTNALDFEPVGPEGHVCAVVVPVALAVAEAQDASGADLLAALVVGLEMGGRVGGAVRRPAQGGAKKTPDVRGTAHAIFGITAAAGRLLGLTPDQLHHAFGIAGYSATLPTLKKVMASSQAPMTKYDHLGLMAQNGIQAALLAQRGFTGDTRVLESEVGFWRFAGALGCDWEFFTRELGSRWTIGETWFKRYPVILYTTPGVDLARRMVREHGIALEDIEKVEIYAMRTNEVQMGTSVENAMDAWTRYSYNVAAGLFDINPRRSWQEPANYQRPDLLALTRKVDVLPLDTDSLTTTGNYWEGWCPVRATIRAGGKTYEGAEDYLPKLDDRELSEKYHENVAGLMPAADAAALEGLCWGLPDVARARDIASLLQGGRQ